MRFNNQGWTLTLVLLMAGLTPLVGCSGDAAIVDDLKGEVASLRVENDKLDKRVDKLIKLNSTNKKTIEDLEIRVKEQYRVLGVSAVGSIQRASEIHARLDNLEYAVGIIIKKQPK